MTTTTTIRGRWAPGNCTTCGYAPDAPFRRWQPNGKITEGCVDEAHTGHLYGESLRWHTSDDARAIRRRTAEYLTALVGEPMRGYGLPGKLKLTGQNRPVHVNGREYDYAPGAAAGMPAGIFAAALAGSDLERYDRLQGYVYCVVEAVGYGIAAGMVGGAVPLLVLAAPDGTRVLVPARLVDVYAIAA